MLQLLSRLFIRRRLEPSFDAAMRDWFAHIEAERQRRGKDVIRQCQRDILPRFTGRRLSAVQKHEIRAMVEEVKHKYGRHSAGKALSYLGRFYNWAVASGLTEYSPAKGLHVTALVGKLESRDRVLSEDELRAIWHATAFNDPHDKIVRLLICTAARREEIGGLMSKELNYKTRQIELPARRTKQKRPHIIPLSDLALAHLPPYRPNREYVFGKGGRAPFSGWSRAKARLDAACGVRDWRLHDLRRSAITIMNERQLAEPWIIEQFVGHLTARSGVQGIYDRSSNLEARRELAQRWADELRNIVGA
jgi:integrase